MNRPPDDFEFFEGTDDMKFPPPTEASGPNGWHETRRVFPDDIRLREHGWKIARRPRRGPALWRKGDLLLSEEDALASIWHALLPG
jgi:hypothetical protein